MPEIIKKMHPLKIIFAGTPVFAASALQALTQTSHQIVAVYTQPDRPSGRGRKITASAVKQLATQYQLPVFQPESLKSPVEQQKLITLNADVMIVAAYGLILPPAVLQAPKLGCINIHASLLPRWRGAAPIQRAILAGDKETGITIMQMNEGLDTGDILKKLPCMILDSDTSATLLERLAELGSHAIVKILDELPTLKAEPQNHDNASYAKKITKDEAKLDWLRPADELERQVRAYNPWPVAFTEKFRVWEATVLKTSEQNTPGVIQNLSPAGIDIATGNNILRIQKLQFPGGKIVMAADILNARHDFVVGGVIA